MIENAIFKLFQTLSSELSSKAKDYAKEILDDFKEKKALESELNIYLKSVEDKHHNSHSEEYEFVFEDIPKIIRNKVFDSNSLRNVFRAVEEGHTNEIDTICTLCIQSANCANEHAKNKVRQIVINCYKIVDEFFSSKIAVENGCLLKKGVDAVNSHTDLVGKEIVSEIAKDLDRREQKLEDILVDTLQKLMSNYQADAVNKICIESDNNKYLGTFKNSLFLDQDNPILSLENMYIEPMVRNGNTYFSECLAEWINSSSYFMMLYGEAGIGKTSLVAKLVDEACERKSCKDNPNDAPVLAIELRRHCECFRSDEDLQAEDVLCQLFNVRNISALSHKLLILDGFDEVTVLVPGFTREKARAFLRDLCTVSNNSYENIYVLVTSREGYFDQHFTDDKVVCENLCWKEKQVSKWCEKYCSIKPNYNEWCQKFLHQYQDLPRNKENDKRHEILCIPFILYLCCNSEIDLEQNKNICQIYDTAFRTILTRKHGKNTSGIEKLESNKEDKRKRIVLWQFTKELAYQMHLLNTLSLSESDKPNSKGTLGFSRAKIRTKQIIKDKFGFNVNEDELTVTSLLAVFSFASNEGTRGFTFAHKTVYEYFTAIKIYEDYLARFNKKYFASSSEDQQMTEVLSYTLEAFRYKTTPEEIFVYLIELCKKAAPPFSETNDSLQQRFDYDSYVKTFDSAVRNECVTELQIFQAVKEYFATYDIENGPDLYEITLSRPNIYTQISCAFRSATWLLSGCLEILENNYLPTCWLELMSYGCDQSVNLSKWKCIGVRLQDADFPDSYFSNSEMTEATMTSSNLSGANFAGADLSMSVLTGSYLDCAIFNDANLTGADLNNCILFISDLICADLKLADMKRAQLTNANLHSSNLTQADLCEADLSYCILDEAILHGANLAMANMQKADLFRAVLDYSTLNKANLCGADLSSVSYIGTDFNGALYDDSTIFPDDFNPIEHGMIQI